MSTKKVLFLGAVIAMLHSHLFKSSYLHPLLEITGHTNIICLFDDLFTKPLKFGLNGKNLFLG
jgi:hypothetical protein